MQDWKIICNISIIDYEKFVTIPAVLVRAYFVALPMILIRWPVDEPCCRACIHFWSMILQSRRRGNHLKHRLLLCWKTIIFLQDLQSVLMSWWFSTSFDPSSSSIRMVGAIRPGNRNEFRRVSLLRHVVFVVAQIWSCWALISAQRQNY